MNICSLVVHARPENAEVVKAGLETFEGVEVHAGIAEGKLIVTVEDEGAESTVADTMHAFNDIKGVVSTTLIYHYGEDQPMAEEVTQ